MDLKKIDWAAQVGRSFETQSPRTVNLPVQRGSTILFDSVEAAFAMGPRTERGEKYATSYGTVGMSTTFALMDAVALLEGGGPGFRAALMPSGLSAVTTLLLALLKPGDHLVVTDSVYGPTRVFCDEYLACRGISTSYVPSDCGADIEACLRSNTRLIYLESPGSYTFEMQDIPAICKIAKSRGIRVAVDNAWASPFYANPFDWGIDFSVLPLTKHWAGHADVLMGALVCREERWLDIWPTIRQLGLCVSSDDAWLVLRGLRTAAVRMKQCSSNAESLITWLQQQASVARVLWPALPDHPQHALWKRDFQGAASLFSVEFKPSISSEQIHAMCNQLTRFGIGYSWGGYESLIMPAKISRTVQPWTGGPLVRISVGLDSVQALIADLEQAFSSAFK